MAPFAPRIANDAVPGSECTGRQPGGRASSAPEGRVTILQAPPSGAGLSQAKGVALLGRDRAVVEFPARLSVPHAVRATAMTTAAAIASCWTGCRAARVIAVGVYRRPSRG